MTREKNPCNSFFKKNYIAAAFNLLINSKWSKKYLDLIGQPETLVENLKTLKQKQGLRHLCYDLWKISKRKKLQNDWLPAKTLCWLAWSQVSNCVAWSLRSVLCNLKPRLCAVLLCKSLLKIWKNLFRYNSISRIRGVTHSLNWWFIGCKNLISLSCIANYYCSCLFLRVIMITCLTPFS